MMVCLVIVLVLGLWGVFFPDARSAQIALNEFLRGSGGGVFDRLAQFIDRIFSPPYAVGLTVVLVVTIGVIRRSLLPAVGCALAVLMAWIPVEALKIIFHQSRPPLSNLLDSLVPVNPQSSFPSGHVGFAVALSFAITLLLRPGQRKIIVATMLSALVAIVAVTRIYAGMHYLSDTVGAIAAAVFGILLFIQVWPVIVNRVARDF
jgi:membrane-associated phospholipid phosphatase